jgi:hypothetical protein
MGALHGLATALLGAGLGVQVFLSYLVAPGAFRLLDRPLAVRLMEGLFPAYYVFGLVTSAMAVALMVGLVLRAGSPLRWGSLGLVLLALAGSVYAGHVLLPRAHAARVRAQAAPAGDLAPLEFSRLHRRAVAVNIAVFAAGALGLALHVAAGAPRGSAERRPDPAPRVPSQVTGSNPAPGQGTQS